VELPVSAFTRRKDARGEFTLLQSSCKRCRQDRLNEWRSTNPEAMRAATKRQSKHRLATSIAWDRAHPDRRKEISRSWRQRNRQYYADREAARRTKKRGFEPYSQRDVFERDEGLCWICKSPIDRSLSGWDEEGFTLDHMAPLSKGGTDTIDNVRAAHRRCNTKRGNRIGEGVLVVKRRHLTMSAA
jgi:5-methylcytosine-specific restriction endonuclease McrA